jgi:hypothetical protein
MAGNLAPHLDGDLADRLVERASPTDDIGGCPVVPEHLDQRDEMRWVERVAEDEGAGVAPACLHLGQREPRSRGGDDRGRVQHRLEVVVEAVLELKDFRHALLTNWACGCRIPCHVSDQQLCGRPTSPSPHRRSPA